MGKKVIYWGLFLIALTTLVWEILLTRIFSATIFYHFVFMSISLAMLGFGCSGIVVYLFPRFFNQEKCADHLTLFSSLFSATVILAIVIYLGVNSALNPSLSTFLEFFKIFFFIFLPYFFSGLTITLILKHYSKNITTLYCYDLVGAGLGCVLIIGLLFIYDGISLVLLTSFLIATASIIFSQQCTTRALKRISLAMALLSLSAFMCNAYAYRFLKIRYVRGIPETGVIFEEWNPINRITVIPENYYGHKSLRINYDSSAAALIFFFDGEVNKVHFLQENIQSFYYQIRKPAEVLIIGAGGGRDVLAAYINGHKKITSVEINPTIVRLNNSIFRDFNGDLFGKPEISMIIDDGRNYIRHSRKEYDIIHIGNVDSWAASASGAFTFSENTLYTVEAFKDYYRHLKDDGVLWLTRWRYNNDVESFRIFTTAVKTMEELGVSKPEQHIIVIADQLRPQFSQAIFLLKKTPFLPEEIRAIDDLRDKMKLEWLHHPERRINSSFDDYLFSPDKKAFLNAYPLNAVPNTDNLPFFFNFLKPIHYIWRLPATRTPFTYPAFLFKVLFIIVSIMVFLTIFLPLMIFNRVRSPSKESASFRWGYLLYFACLGLGFMLVEIPLIQKFILFLGQPLYAIVVILSSLLIFSGIGSLMAGKFSGHTIHKRLCMVIIILCGLLVGYLYGLPAVFQALLGSSGFTRVISSILIIAPLGAIMGMALPLGIQLIEQDAPAMIPWVWGVNGACSVMGSIVAWGLSLNFGYNTTSWTAILVYGCAVLVMILKPYASQTHESLNC